MMHFLTGIAVGIVLEAIAVIAVLLITSER